ncbi:MAG TPA: hypothetical protein VF661_11855 [Actinomycetales bacterium]
MDLNTCGSVPTSEGPKAELLGAKVGAPSRAASGATLHLTVDVFSVTGRAMTMSTGYAEVLITRDGHVVGKHVGGNASPGVNPGRIEGSTSGRVPAVVALLGCPQEPIDLMDPIAARLPLPPGEYELVAVVTDSGIRGTGSTVLVSAPTTIQIE